MFNQEFSQMEALSTTRTPPCCAGHPPVDGIAPVIALQPKMALRHQQVRHLIPEKTCIYSGQPPGIIVLGQQPQLVLTQPDFFPFPNVYWSHPLLGNKEEYGWKRSYYKPVTADDVPFQPYHSFDQAVGGVLGRDIDNDVTRTKFVISCCKRVHPHPVLGVLFKKIIETYLELYEGVEWKIRTDT